MPLTTIEIKTGSSEKLAWMRVEDYGEYRDAKGLPVAMVRISWDDAGISGGTAIISRGLWNELSRVLARMSAAEIFKDFFKDGVAVKIKRGRF